jgi:hypothetical protein
MQSKAELMPRSPTPAAQCLSLVAFSPGARRARFSVGLGCPSYGGQRTDCGASGRLLASLVTGLRSSLSGKRLVGHIKLYRQPYFAKISSDRAPSHLASEPRSCSSPSRPNSERQMPEASTCQRCASGLSIQSLSAVAVSRSGHSLAQPGSPNHSVKGTSRRRAAPYVER